MGILTQFVRADGPVFVDQYEQAVGTADKSVLIVFGADWCGYCVRLKNDKESLNLDEYVVCFVDADKNPEMVKENSVSSFPTSIVMHDGKEVSRKTGYKKTEYQKWLDSNREHPKKVKIEVCDCGCLKNCKCSGGCK